MGTQLGYNPGERRLSPWTPWSSSSRSLELGNVLEKFLSRAQVSVAECGFLNWNSNWTVISPRLVLTRSRSGCSLNCLCRLAPRLDGGDVLRDLVAGVRLPKGRTSGSADTDEVLILCRWVELEA